MNGAFETIRIELAPPKQWQQLAEYIDRLGLSSSEAVWCALHLIDVALSTAPESAKAIVAMAICKAVRDKHDSIRGN